MADAKMKVSQMGNVVITDDYDIMNVVTYNSQSQTYTSGKANVKVLKDYMIGDNNISALGDGSVTGAILNVKSTSETADSNIAETMAHNGAHQFLYNRIKSSVIVGGLTITPHDDGSFTVGAGTATSEDTIMVSGTGTSSWSQAEQKLPVGNYYASCEGAVEGVYLRLNVEENNQQKIVRGTDVSIAVSSAPSNTLAFIQVLSGTVIPAGGITIKPLIRLQSDTVKTIAPYTMTNAELTEKKVVDITPETGFTVESNNSFECAGVLYLNFILSASTAVQTTVLQTVASINKVPSVASQLSGAGLDDNGYLQGAIGGRLFTNGYIVAAAPTGTTKLYIEGVILL